MDPLVRVRSSSAPPPDGGRPGIVRWLSTSNPFYVLSAVLFLAGLRVSFGTHAREVDTWALMGAATLAFGAGLIDDLRPGGPRGLRGHARELASFRVTTGVLKALAGVVAGVLVVLTVHGRAPWVDPYSFRPESEPRLNPSGWPFGLPFWALWRALGTVQAWNAFVLLSFVAAGFALVVSGTFATAAGPHPGDKAEVDRLGSLYDAVQLHVRVTAVFGIGLLLLIGVLFRRRRELLDVLGVSLVLLAVVLTQMAVGETQWRTQLPWGLVLVHVSLAAAIWGLTVLVVYLLWRPARVWARDRTRLSG